MRDLSDVTTELSKVWMLLDVATSPRLAQSCLHIEGWYCPHHQLPFLSFPFLFFSFPFLYFRFVSFLVVSSISPSASLREKQEEYFLSPQDPFLTIQCNFNHRAGRLALLNPSYKRGQLTERCVLFDCCFGKETTQTKSPVFGSDAVYAILAPPTLCSHVVIILFAGRDLRLFMEGLWKS